MHTDSSASSTCFWLKSAVECTATVLMPSSRQARKIRSAISPRLAMTTFSNMLDVYPWVPGAKRRGHATKLLFDDEQRLAELDRVAVFHQHRGDPAGLVGFDLVHHLHGFDDAERIADVHFAADVDERLGAR